MPENNRYFVNARIPWQGLGKHKIAVVWLTGMKEIQLSNSDLKTLVDDADYDELSKHKWYARPNGAGVAYVIRSQKIAGKTKVILMHRQLLDFPTGLDVHHKNHNPLDNRRENLEAITHKENLSKRQEYKNKSGVKGVYWSNGKWRMFLDRDFDNLEDAGKAYQLAAAAINTVYPPYR